MEKKVLVTNSALATQKLGEKIGKSLKNGEILALYGELGSGKTTFVQGLAKGLGIKKRILSPTFVMVRPYAISHKRYASFYHIDLYRINSLKEAQGLGLEEIFSDPQNIIVIEWAEKIKKILPKKRWDIYFEYLSEDTRKIVVKKYPTADARVC